MCQNIARFTSSEYYQKRFFNIPCLEYKIWILTSKKIKTIEPKWCKVPNYWNVLPLLINNVTKKGVTNVLPTSKKTFGLVILWSTVFASVASRWFLCLERSDRRQTQALAERDSSQSFKALLQVVVTNIRALHLQCLINVLTYVFTS